MRLGNVDCHLLSDGEFRLDGGGVFGHVPRVLWEKVLAPDELNRVPMALNCLLVLSEGKRILVDAGYGRKLGSEQRDTISLQRPNGDLLEGLERLGYRPSDIDIVINTHLHPDHCGGNTVLADGAATPAFPRAKYWVQVQEWEAAFRPNERTRPTYPEENWRCLEKSGQLHLENGDAAVTSEVSCLHTPGHTRGHQSVLIQSCGLSACFAGDVAARAVHLERLSWTTAFDTEPLLTLESKRRLQNRCLQSGTLVYFAHDVSVPSGRLSLDQQTQRLRVVPE